MQQVKKNSSQKDIIKFQLTVPHKQGKENNDDYLKDEDEEAVFAHSEIHLHYLVVALVHQLNYVLSLLETGRHMPITKPDHDGSNSKFSHACLYTDIFYTSI